MVTYSLILVFSYTFQLCSISSIFSSWILQSIYCWDFCHADSTTLSLTSSPTKHSLIIHINASVVNPMGERKLRLTPQEAFFSFISNTVPFLQYFLCTWGRQHVLIVLLLMWFIRSSNILWDFKPYLRISLWAKANKTYYQSWATSCMGINRAWNNFNIKIK